ncbi:MAG: NAD(P)-dependent oxidoreductase [Crocinitomicaceae bacterium]|nr:NAD(P)-dependent oxidoreductase [Crocinitomicaceae bacterium]
MRVLITGATGNIGIEILKKLSPLDHEITILARRSKKNTKALKQFKNVKIIYGDITSQEDVNQACKNQDYALHLAAVIPPLVDEKPALADKVNLEGTRNIINGLEKHSPNCFLIFSSSVTVYGDRINTPVISINDPIQTTKWDKYGQAKIESEKLIQNSSLDWSIFRLSAIMGIGNHKVSKILFHVPLNTIMEIATVDDTSRAFAKSIGKRKVLNKQIFNLGGGKDCVITYQAFLNRAFKSFGLGNAEFPNKTFAEANFHCGEFSDSDKLEEILKFRKDNIDSYFEQFKASVPRIQRFLTIPFSPIIKYFLGRISEPRKAIKENNKEDIQRYFGTTTK